MKAYNGVLFASSNNVMPLGWNYDARVGFDGATSFDADISSGWAVGDRSVVHYKGEITFARCPAQTL